MRWWLCQRCCRVCCVALAVVLAVVFVQNGRFASLFVCVIVLPRLVPIPTRVLGNIHSYVCLDLVVVDYCLICFAFVCFLLSAFV